MSKKMWALMVYLTFNQWSDKKSTKLKENDELLFDDDFWNYIVDESQKCGINTILLDVGDGLQFASHPEIAVRGAWTRKRAHDEVKRCREKGITIIPKLNFATTHSYWLGEYRRMTSTSIYYKVVADLIKEVYEVFEKPPYIHLGMDEESEKYLRNHSHVVFRQGDLYWNDLRFMVDCVKETGAIPWVWSNPLFENPEEYKKRFDADEVVFSPYYYNAFRKEHWTPVESRADYVAYYNEGEYAKMGIKFVEEDPFLVDFREKAIPLMKEGYKYIPCASVFNRCDYNHDDLLEYFKENAPDDQIIGFISAPWAITLPEERSKMFYEETFRFFKEAREKFYKGE